jgi:hypothetical protein
MYYEFMLFVVGITLGKISSEGRDRLFVSANYSTRIPNLRYRTERSTTGGWRRHSAAVFVRF